MKMRLSFALLTLLIAQVASADSKQETAEGMLRRAAQTSGPTCPLTQTKRFPKYAKTPHSSPRLQCVEINRQNVPPSMKERSFCFDEANGALVRITDGGRRTEFSDFENRNGALIARKAQQFR